jgi:hypothetical protein
MAMLDAEVLRTVGRYFVEHPEELARIARNAAALKFGVPLAAVRWLATRAGSMARRAPSDVLIEAVPPGVRVGATLELMGTRLRASALIFVEELSLRTTELRVELRLAEVSLSLLDGSDSPLGALIRSGALDLTKVGNLVGVMPRRPSFLVEAKGDRIVLDLKRHPLFGSQKIETVLALLTPLVNLKGVSTDLEHIDFEFALFEQGLSAALQTWRSLV